MRIATVPYGRDDLPVPASLRLLGGALHRLNLALTSDELRVTAAGRAFCSITASKKGKAL